MTRPLVSALRHMAQIAGLIRLAIVTGRAGRDFMTTARKTGLLLTQPVHDLLIVA